MPYNMSENVLSDSLFYCRINKSNESFQSFRSGLPILSRRQHLKRPHLKFIILSFIILLLSTNFAYGAISVTSSTTIQGRKPYLLLSDGKTKLTDLKALLSFRMPKRDGTDGTEQIETSMAGNIIEVPKGMKYEDVITVVKADGTLHSLTNLLVGDDDGDAMIADNTNVTGQIRATWYKGEEVVPVSDLDKPLEAYEGSYSLKIEIPTSITATTTYGNPRINDYGTHPGIIYTFVTSH